MRCRYLEPMVKSGSFIFRFFFFFREEEWNRLLLWAVMQQEPFSWGLSGIAPDRARPPFFGVPQSPAVHAAGRFH